MARRVTELLRETASRHPRAELLVMPDRLAAAWGLRQASLTYAEVLAAAETLAARYRAAGWGAGHRVALALGNRPAHFLHFLALNAAGASMVPLNPEAPEAELRWILEHSGAGLLVAAPPGRGPGDGRTAAEAARGLGLPVIGAEDPPPPSRAAASGGAEDEAALLYTSGTSGRPKGCLLSNRYFLGWADWYAAQPAPVALRPGEERLVTPLPTFHTNGTGHSFMGMLATGGAQVILDRFHPRSWWQDAAATRATCFHYLGVMPAMLLALPPAPEERAHRLRFGLGGGVAPAHHAAFEARFGVPLLEGWAMTETGGAGCLCAVAPPRHPGARCIGHPARPGPAMELRVVDAAGAELPPGEPGEMEVRAAGPDPRAGFFSGYLKDAAATAAAWRDGWLRTGDVVRRDADGHVFFVDRAKNVIRRSGENIAALEVEAALAAHPAVAQVAVVGIPDPIREEEVLAAVVPRPGHAPDRALAEALQRHALDRLSYFKAPGFVLFADRLPTTSTQKPRKPEVAALAEAARGTAALHDLTAGKRRAS